MGRVLVVLFMLSAVSLTARGQTPALRQARHIQTAGIVVLGVGAGSFTAGAVLLGVGVSQNSDATCINTPGVVGCGSHSINAEMIAGWTAMGVGLVALGVGIPLFIVGRERVRRASRVAETVPSSVNLAAGPW